MVGFAGLVWVAAVATSNRRLNWFTLPFARYGAGGAIIGGICAALIACVRSFADGAGLGKRYEWEASWLLGAALGGLVGSVIGGGIGIGAHNSIRFPERPMPKND